MALWVNHGQEHVRPHFLPWSDVFLKLANGPFSFWELFIGLDASLWEG